MTISYNKERKCSVFKKGHCYSFQILFMAALVRGESMVLSIVKNTEGHQHENPQKSFHMFLLLTTCTSAKLACSLQADINIHHGAKQNVY